MLDVLIVEKGVCGFVVKCFGNWVVVRVLDVSAVFNWLRSLGVDDVWGD